MDSIHNLLKPRRKQIPEDSKTDLHMPVVEATALQAPRENTMTYHWLLASVEILPAFGTDECGFEIKVLVLKERLLAVEVLWLLWSVGCLHLLQI